MSANENHEERSESVRKTYDELTEAEKKQWDMLLAVARASGSAIGVPTNAGLVFYDPDALPSDMKPTEAAAPDKEI